MIVTIAAGQQARLTLNPLEPVQTMTAYIVQVSLGVAVICLMLSIIFDPDSVRRFLTGRQARYGSSSLGLVLVSFGLAAVLNYLSFKYDQRWDLTQDQLNTFAPETLEILANLPEPAVTRLRRTIDSRQKTRKRRLDAHHTAL